MAMAPSVDPGMLYSSTDETSTGPVQDISTKLGEGVSLYSFSPDK